MFTVLFISAFILYGILSGAIKSIPKKPLNKKTRSPMYGWQPSDLDQDVIYPWEFVFSECRVIPYRNDNLVNCPKCMKEEGLDDDVIVVEHSSPPWTWRKLCGRTYAIYICKKHKKQFHQELTRMN